MADTIITNTPDSGDSAMGGVVALIIVGVLVVGAIFLYQTGAFSTMTNPDTTEVNVTIPNPTPGPTPAPTPTPKE